jgi:starch phosphorylase
MLSLKLAPVLVKAWKVQIGSINLYLLDTNIPENDEENRAITNQLYGDDEHIRIKQEIVLGIGGVRILRKLGLTPTVWHMNEGHSAFLILERIRELRAKGLSLEAALEAIKVNSVFTTHTPVPAGHDHFSRKLMSKYLSSFSHHELCLDEDDLMALGHFPNKSSDFNMTALAIRGSHYLNGVSRLHGQVASSMFAAFWPKPAQNPVDYVTNGVHVSSFLAREWRDLFDERLGAGWRKQLCDAEFWKKGIENIPDKTFWETKQGIKSQMLAAIRERLSRQNRHNGISKADSEEQLKFVANPNKNVLTIGFARRFITYKRATLLLNNLETLQSLISGQLPIVFIFSGKAHPADEDAQKLIKELYQTALEPEFWGHILVLEGYDLALSRHLVAGADVWLNNPVCPQEASGTSGMKVAINGGLNLSILDGWWPEGYDGKNGWGIKPSPHGDNKTLRDHEDAQSLYKVLSDEVIPLYSKGKDGYSPDWIKKAKHAMATILPRFNSERMVNEYLEKFYVPASNDA